MGTKKRKAKTKTNTARTTRTTRSEDRESPHMKQKGKDNWHWNVNVAYRITVDNVPVFKCYGAAPEDKKLAVLPLGYEFSSKSGRRSVSGDEWLRVSKSSGIDEVKSVAWVPAKLLGKVFAEEVPEDDTDSESELGV